MNLQLPFCFCFFLLLQLPFSTNGQAYKNVSLGSSLTAASGDLPWTSPSGEFAFGFQQVGDAGYLLAIWFDKIPERTIVWSADRNNLVQSGSTVQLTADGQLVLNYQSGTQIWTTPELGGSGAAYGAMLDTGNFVLAGQAGANLWQSFNQPTDTLLPTQNLNPGGELIAPYLEKNYLDGRFKLILQRDGNLVMYTIAYPLTASNAYWSTGTRGSGHQLIFNQSGLMYLVATNGTILEHVFSNQVSLQDFYLRATIDYDGVFRQYVYPKTASGGNMNWTTLPNSIPSNICLGSKTLVGSGVCGFNSYCTIGDDRRPSCSCLPGYTFLNQNDVRKGCKQMFISQDCSHPSQETDSFEIKDMPNTNFQHNDYEVLNSVDEDWCRQSCLSDCYCAVATFMDRQCWKKRGPLSNGVTDPIIIDKALMKVRKGNHTEELAQKKSAKKRDPSALIVTGSVLLGSSIFLIVLSLLGIYVFFTRRNRQKQKLIPQHHVMRDMNLQNFTYNELETATGGFDEELGRGAFGPVYKGVLGGEDKQIIAVKRLEKMAGEGETEFKTEVTVIGRTNHKNLVQLVGFCNEGQHRLLVYEYMSGGSLSNYIFGDSRPNWHRRLQIAFGVARGLLYLHEECSSQIIHCDIKPQNILLDESFNARISDFGLAKLLKTEQSKTITVIRGTKGYRNTTLNHALSQIHIMNLQLPYCFCFFLLLQLPFSTNGQAYKNVSLGSSLTAASGDLPWTSPSGDFAFGFQQVSDAGYLLSIWFNKIPERTIVWSANRNNLAQSGSTVQLTADGQLVLNDQSGTRIRNTAYLGGSGTAYGAMLDTGNFVLAGQAGDTLWQSFDQPTDSLLPTQNLKLGAQLIAPYLEKNYSDGRFKLILEDDGNLVMRTTAYPLTTSNFAYWSAGSSLGSGNQLTGSGNQLIFNQSGYMYVVASNGTILSHVFSNPVPLQDLYLRATIDYDGVFRQYVYPKTASGGKRWAMASTTLQTSIPPNICLAIRYSAGSGACGFNSYCTLGDDQRPSCRCPHGYTFSDKDDERKGCKKTFISQDCDHPSQEIDSFEIRVLLNTNFPFADYEFFGSVSEDWCRQSCLSDCYCDVATFNKVGQCWKKRGPLLNGVTDPSIGDKALMKVGKGNRTEELAQKKCAKKSNGSALIISGSVILGSSIFLIVLYNFTYNELETATGGFDEELGRGAFGPVYKGVLGGEDKQMIAVKRLEKMAGEGETEFKTEVTVIGRTNHKNLVQLVGFCNEGQHRLLVYEYMSGGSLSNYIFGDSRPNWHRRMQIALGVARGLLYLHEECSSQIIHCDIKPQNILLDESFNARISDFGLAKLLKTEQSKTTTAIRGTKGYVAPEWFKNLPVTTKVDTYSFGILLLELVCCRKNYEINAREEHQILLEDWACDCFKEGKLNLLVEEDEEAMEDMKRVERFVMVAIWCIQEDPSLRPAMKKVVQMLEEGVQLSVPPDPSSFFSSI
ncbi:G-type lectin S-receptor serine/threonine-protein kinase [Salix suchowensis]|nr:G-type lectin S-receptor serine/threonine-protein kinase [Salix suchowensis]